MRPCPRFRLLLIVALVALLLAACSTQPRVVAVRRAAPYGAPAPRVAERPGYYRVVAGDTLYSIAFRHQMDYRELARINSIGPPYTIYPGQELRLHRAPGMTGIAPPPVAAAPAVVTTPTAAATVAATASSSPMSMNGAAAMTPAPASAKTAVISGGPTRSVDGIVWRWPVDGPVLAGFEADEPGRQGLDIGGHMGQPVYAAASGVVVYSGSGLVGYGELIIIKHSDSYLSAYGHNSVRLVKEGQNVVAGQEIAEMGNSGAPRVELHFEIRKDGKPLNPQDFLPRR
ncbi:peptidoglycan DD-metalloendopeptidase family protein [Metallibacterium scheffleri]